MNEKSSALIGRTRIDDLEPSSDYLIMLLHGLPFNGLAFEEDSEGRLIAEVPYTEGKKFGTARTWFSTGVLRTEQDFALDALHGHSREWTEAGKVLAEGSYELGILISEARYGADGRTASQYLLAESSPQFKTLQLLRSSNLAVEVQRLASMSRAPSAA